MPTPAATHGRARASSAKRSKINALRLSPFDTGAPILATPAKTIGTHASAAVRDFLTQMAGEIGADALSFKLWRHSYDGLRAANGWPELSDKVLALALRHAGCRYRQIDDRRRSRGRYAAYEIPPSLVGECAS